MNWLLGKLSRPALSRAFRWFQNEYPDSGLTPALASLATAENPLAPTETAATPFDVVPSEDFKSLGDVQRKAPQTLKNLATGMIETRAKSYALKKVVNVTLAQVMLPLTLILWIIKLLIGWIEERRVERALNFKSADSHDADVVHVVNQIKARPPDKYLASKRAGSQGHMMRSNETKKQIGPATAMTEAGRSKHSLHFVDLDHLTSVLAVDTEADTCIVQAGCTFRNLLRATTHHHLMPQVVPPFLNMTVGGAVSGSAIGTTSWQKGAFIESVIEMEVALGSGEVILVDRSGPHAALFHGLNSSFHSIGTIVSLRLQLVHAPRYVWMKYENYNSMDKATKRLNTLLNASPAPPIDNLEAIMFSPKNITIAMTQGLEEINPSKHKVVSFAHWFDQPYHSYLQQWSYRAQSTMSDTMPIKHCISLMDYLGRYDYEAFWIGSFVYSILPWPLKGSSFVSRLLVGWTLDEQNIRSGIEQSEQHARFERTRLVQDAHIPLHHLSPFLHWTWDQVKITPIWLCPVLGSSQDLLAPNYIHAGSEKNSAHGFHYVNVGLYGRSLTPVWNASQMNANLLQQVYEAGGRTMLHAHNFHSSELWSQMMNRKEYDQLRQEYGAHETYPDLFTKVTASTSAVEMKELKLTKSLEGDEEVAVVKSLGKEILTRKFKFWSD